MLMLTETANVTMIICLITDYIKEINYQHVFLMYAWYKLNENSIRTPIELSEYVE